MLKKLCSYLLTFLTLILSLGAATGCVFDPSINVKRVDANAYIYNGERYVYTEEMDRYNIDTFYSYNEVGYACDGMGQKYTVAISEQDAEENVIMLIGDHYFRFSCHKFYVKESTSFPASFLDANYSSVFRVMNKEIKIDFQLKEVLSLSPIYQDDWLLEREDFCCYLENFHPIYMRLGAYLDSQNDMYITEDLYIWYKVTDKNFKAAVMQLCF